MSPHPLFIHPHHPTRPGQHPWNSAKISAKEGSFLGAVSQQTKAGGEGGGPPAIPPGPWCRGQCRWRSVHGWAGKLLSQQWCSGLLSRRRRRLEFILPRMAHPCLGLISTNSVLCTLWSWKPGLGEDRPQLRPSNGSSSLCDPRQIA